MPTWVWFGLFVLGLMLAALVWLAESGDDEAQLLSDYDGE